MAEQPIQTSTFPPDFKTKCVARVKPALQVWPPIVLRMRKTPPLPPSHDPPMHPPPSCIKILSLCSHGNLINSHSTCLLSGRHMETDTDRWGERERKRKRGGGDTIVDEDLHFKKTCRRDEWKHTQTTRGHFILHCVAFCLNLCVYFTQLIQFNRFIMLLIVTKCKQPVLQDPMRARKVAK